MIENQKQKIDIELETRYKTLKVYPIDEDGEIEIEIFYESIWLSKEQTQQLIKSLLKQIGN
jgi:hypothetical protein